MTAVHLDYFFKKYLLSLFSFSKLAALFSVAPESLPLLDFFKLRIFFK